LHFFASIFSTFFLLCNILVPIDLRKTGWLWRLPCAAKTRVFMSAQANNRSQKLLVKNDGFDHVCS